MRYTSKTEDDVNELILSPSVSLWSISEKDMTYRVRGDAIDKFASYEDLEEQGLELQDKRINILIQYIHENMHWCPFKDESGIDFEKECVGFREPGCRECILRNIDKLN